MEWNHPRELLMHAGLGGTLLSVMVILISVYVRNEHTIYISDYAGFQNMTHSIASQYHVSPSSALLAIARSMAGEYNAIFTIPLVPWMLALGESRLTYEIALGVVYLLPYIIVVGALAVELIHARPQTVFWSTVLLASLTPAVWVPTLRGYPDTGAAAIMSLAMWVYLRDTRLRHVWQMSSIGILITGAVLFRRPFAYAALAFFAAIALQALIRFILCVRSEPKTAWREFGANVLRIGLIASVSLAMMVIFGRSFLIRFLTVDYTALYAGYTRPPLSSFTWYIAVYGWLVVGAAVIGFILGIRYRILRSDPVIFVILFSGLTLLAWLLLARQTGEQYTLNFTSTVVLGLAALLWTVISISSPTPRRIMLTGSIALLSANLILSLAPVTLLNNTIIHSFFAMQEAPFTRSDQAQVARLVDYFRQIAGDGEPIYVAASSEIMGKDTLVSAERMLYGWSNARLNVLYSPEIDSRDFYPLQLLLQTQYVLVVDPFQYHLSPEQQRVVQVVYDIFKNNREFARDFVELPEHFPLDGGTVASVYQRAHPTSIPTAITTLEFMRSFVQIHPGAQPGWMLLDQTPISTIHINQDHTYTVTTQLLASQGINSSDLLYLGALPDRGVLRGEITFLDKACVGINLRLADVSGSGQVEILREMKLHPSVLPHIALPLEKRDAGFLMLSLENSRPASTGTCSINIDHLRVAPT